MDNKIIFNALLRFWFGMSGMVYCGWVIALLCSKDMFVISYVIYEPMVDLAMKVTIKIPPQVTWVLFVLIMSILCAAMASRQKTHGIIIGIASLLNAVCWSIIALTFLMSPYISTGAAVYSPIALISWGFCVLNIK